MFPVNGVDSGHTLASNLKNEKSTEIATQTVKTFLIFEII